MTILSILAGVGSIGLTVAAFLKIRSDSSFGGMAKAAGGASMSQGTITDSFNFHFFSESTDFQLSFLLLELLFTELSCRETLAHPFISALLLLGSTSVPPCFC